MNPEKFPDTKITQKNGIVMAEVNQKGRKLPAHWTFRVPNPL